MRSQLAELAKRVAVAVDRRAALGSAAYERLSATMTVLLEDHPGAPADEGHDRLAGLADVLGLDALDVSLFVAAAAPDLDANFALAYGLLRGGDVPAEATIGLALELSGVASLAPDGFAHLAVSAPLREHGLLDVREAGPWLGREVAVPERVLAHLLGVDELDPALRTALVPAVSMPFPEADRLARGLEAGARLAWVHSPPPTSGLTLAAGTLTALGLGRLVIDLHRCGPDSELGPVLRAAAREAALRGVGLVVAGADRLGRAGHLAAFAMLERTPVPVVLVGTTPWDPTWLPRHPVVAQAPKLRPSDRAAAWQVAAGFDEPSAGLAALRLTPESIAQAADYAATLSATQDEPVTDALVLQAARAVGGSRTAGRRSTLGFDSLVLPDYAATQLHRLVAWAEHRDEVLSRSVLFDNDRKGRGIAALFSGSPGTGKTLAANVIAGELGLDVFQVDLSEVVDKYIGETEKNLERVFREAESLNVVLFFDEADALFGKRSDVKDAHDRYANQEVAYLLQRIEHFDGISILATNLRGNLDQAFIRRMQFIVHFPDPDAPTRRRLWELYLNRVDRLDADDPVDVAHLAATVEVAGGDIRNIVLASVYDSISAGEAVGMRHILTATVDEYRKLGRRVPDDGFAPPR